MKAISFDFWGTLCVGNPAYKDAQLKVAQEFELGLTQTEWDSRRKKVKSHADHLAESKGEQVPLLKMYKILLPKCSKKQRKECIKILGKLFVKYPPILIIDKDFMDRLKDAGYRVYISSNTVLTSGKYLSKVIYNHFGIVKSNCNLSDKVGHAKPNFRMFKFPIKPEYHVGDNVRTDGACQSLGIKYIQVSTKLEYNQIKLNQLLNQIHDASS
jgi:FMN phosphatase YigB (HAD superfamily)